MNRGWSNEFEVSYTETDGNERYTSDNNENEYDNALKILDKGIQISIESHNFNGECECNKMKGDILFKLNKYDNALLYYKKYLKISIEMSNKNNQGNGYFLLGMCYEKTNDDVLALKYFELFMNIAHESNQLKLESKAALLLGDIYIQNPKKYDDAVKYYNKNFQLTKKIKCNTQYKNEAKIKLAIAKAYQYMNTYIKHINNNDIKSLLLWKNKRKKPKN